MARSRHRPITSPNGLSATQRTVYDAIVASRGAAIGPFTVLLHRAEIAASAESLGGYLRYKSPLAADVREAVILTVATLLECEFERHAHEPIARKAGVDVDAIVAGRDLDGEAGLATAIARALLVDHRIPDVLFARAQARWDEAALVDLISLVGYYAFLAAVLNGFEVTP